jgi:hypothetical protein
MFYLILTFSNPFSQQKFTCGSTTFPGLAPPAEKNLQPEYSGWRLNITWGRGRAGVDVVLPIRNQR